MNWDEFKKKAEPIPLLIALWVILTFVFSVISFLTWEFIERIMATEWVLNALVSSTPFVISGGIISAFIVLLVVLDAMLGGK